MAEAAKEAGWISQLLMELGVQVGTIPVLNDNAGALSWSTDTKTRKQSRHIKVKYHLVRERIQDGTIKVDRVDTENCAADGLTKPLDRVKVVRSRDLMRLRGPDGRGDT